MSDPIDPNLARLQSIDSVTLTPIVRRALGDSTLVVNEWIYQQVHGGVGGGAGGTAVYRCSGTAAGEERTAPWSVILKVTSARPGEQPGSTHYWKREAEFYQSGPQVDIAGRFRPAHCYGVVEYPDEACWIWQEDVTGAVNGRWTLDEYMAHARNIGWFNAQYLNGQPAPHAQWMSDGWLRQIAAATAPHIEKILNDLRQPHVLKEYPADADDQFLRLWNVREPLLSALDRLPQTLCHQDPVRRNLFLRPNGGGFETIAIDWAYVGHAAIGMDIAVPLIIDPLFSEFDVLQARELTEALFQGYVEGLHESGWHGELRRVRLGFLVSAACKYVEAFMLTAVFNLFDLSMAETYVQVMGQTMDEAIAVDARMFRFMMTVLDEALDLLDA